jgi:hypothetical protein
MTNRENDPTTNPYSDILIYKNTMVHRTIVDDLRHQQTLLDPAGNRVSQRTGVSVNVRFMGQDLQERKRVIAPQKKKNYRNTMKFESILAKSLISYPSTITPKRWYEVLKVCIYNEIPGR